MKKFQFENGLSKNVIRRQNGILPYGYVEMQDGRVFTFSNKYNDTIADHYEVMVENKSGRRLNVNKNNGVAYLTVL